MISYYIFLRILLPLPHPSSSTPIHLHSSSSTSIPLHPAPSLFIQPHPSSSNPIPLDPSSSTPIPSHLHSFPIPPFSFFRNKTTCPYPINIFLSFRINNKILGLIYKAAGVLKIGINNLIAKWPEMVHSLHKRYTILEAVF